MMIRILAVLTLLGGLVPALASAQSTVPVLPPGLHVQTLERANAPAVGYALAIPRTYSNTSPVPLVLALHFGVQGGSSEGAGRDVVGILIAPGLAELGAIIVAPDSIDGQSWSTPENEAAVLALLDQVIRSYRLDPKKVIVTGFSMGGMGTWHFAGKFPERFAAAVPVAGRPGAMPAGGWRVPVFAVHSRRDELVPLGPAQQRIDELKRGNVAAELVILDRPTHFNTGGHTEGLKQAVPWLRQILK